MRKMSDTRIVNKELIRWPVYSNNIKSKQTNKRKIYVKQKISLKIIFVFGIFLCFRFICSAIIINLLHNSARYVMLAIKLLRKDVCLTKEEA